MTIQWRLIFYTFFLITSSYTQAEERYALVIGNAAYPEYPLINPVNDAIDIAIKLRQRGFHVTKVTNAKLKQMDEAIDTFTDNLKDKDAVGLFYYSGHGLEVNNQNYLVPIDAQLHDSPDVNYETINAGKLLDRMTEAGNRLNLVILDACRNNPFKRSWIHNGGRNVAGGGLAQMQVASGTLIMYATEPYKTAADGEGRNGTFTKHLLPALDLKGIDIEIAFKDISDKVSRETSGQQVPWSEGVIHGHFMFIPSNTSPSTTETPPTIQPELQLAPAPVQPQYLIPSPSIKEKLALCQQHLKTNQLTSGENGTAFDCYNSVLKQDPTNTEALVGLEAIADKYRDWAKNALKQGHEDQAQEFLSKAEMIKNLVSIQGPYYIRSDGTVTDSKSGLMWKRCAEHQDGPTCSGVAATYSWDAAKQQFNTSNNTNFADYKDWRLPTIEELHTLIWCGNSVNSDSAPISDCSNHNDSNPHRSPTINPVAFPNTPDAWFWSASLYQPNINHAWLVNFNSGYSDWYHKSYAGYVRLVRTGK